MTRAFVIRPFGKKRDSEGRELDFDRVHKELIGPALRSQGYVGDTTGEVVEAGNIRKEMFAMIVEADLVVCDVSAHNANVFYELGIRHALRRGHTFLVRDKRLRDAPPFDLLTDRYFAYDGALLEGDAPDQEGLKKEVAALAQAFAATRDKEHKDDSPVFSYVPELHDQGSAALRRVPDDLRLEIERACTAKMPGWLRLLAHEVQGRRFQWAALRHIGKALWDVGDIEAATRIWKRIREQDSSDVEANLALANLFERSYRKERRLDLLTQSDQCLTGLLGSEQKLSQAERAEALALVARNAKTRWRASMQAPTLEERRKNAVSAALLRAYEHYRRAFLVDLNHYWSGLAAVQMAVIAKSLTREDAWKELFDSDQAAEDYARTLDTSIQELRACVEVALARAEGGVDRWRAISAVDLKFLFSDSPVRVTKSYVDLFEDARWFEWDAARGQLQLFADLGIHGGLASDVIARVDRLVQPEERVSREVVVFVGHRIDEPGRDKPRFPAAAEGRARALIRDKLQELHARSPNVRVLASAAPGADILCHEVCGELGIESVVCLPMPAKEVARLAFGELDAWRTRLFDIVRARAGNVLELADQEGLPRWLRNTDANEWERGNVWTLEMARSSGASRVSLVALWDGQPDAGGQRGGTAHMVRIARSAPVDEVHVLDTAQLR